MHLLMPIVLAAFVVSGCAGDRTMTLDPGPLGGAPDPAASGRPVTVAPVVDRRGAIAESESGDGIGGLYGVREWPAALLVSEPYSVALQHALVAALTARGIPAVSSPPGPANPAEAYVMSTTIVDFYGVSNWGAQATLSAYVRLTGPDGSYVADKTVRSEVNKWIGLDSLTPRLEDVMNRVMREWVEAVASDPQITGPLRQ
ncbi:MAG TPA: hypothetical protein VMT79_06910 [Candidatus Binatia bacterium]|nr:hypothetical protein [Candidatus Binatia bacterium]